MKIRAFSPGHITGFFQIFDEAKNPLEKGSRGAGVSVSKGVTTSVEASPAKNTQISVEINGDSSHPTPVSKSVITRFLDFVPKQSFNIHVRHDVALPIGCGFGTSGAGALSLSLALDKALELNLPRIKSAQIAHLEEIALQTGLGTVIAESVGGIEIRTHPGAPGIGQIMTLPSSREYMLVSLPFGPISTSKHLKDEDLRKRINERGGLFTDALRTHPTVANFLKYSRNFAEHIGIITDRVKAVLQEADEVGFTCSTAIFGENVFSLVQPDQVSELKALFESHKSPEFNVLIMNVDCEGARIIDE